MGLGSFGKIVAPQALAKPGSSGERPDQGMGERNLSRTIRRASVGLLAIAVLRRKQHAGCSELRSTGGQAKAYPTSAAAEGMSLEQIKAEMAGRSEGCEK